MSGALAAAAVLVLACPAAVTIGAAVVTAGPAVAGPPCGPGGPPALVAGQQLDVEQLANARTITATTAERGMPARAAVIAVATAMTESGLRNLRYGDRDSLGLFQQRASWGPATARLDPAGSTGLFLDALAAVPDWPQLPVAAAADHVQHSAYPWRVNQWHELAATLVASQVSYASSGSVVSREPSAGSTAAAVPAAVPCTGNGGDEAHPAGFSGGTPLSATGVLPSPGAQGVVVAFAVRQLGKPYVWGATGPAAYDCSGLTQQAWAAAGVALPRTTYSQVLTGVPVTDQRLLQAGDLLFTAGSDGTPANPGHVGLYAGLVDGTPALIEAPHTGAVVRITPLRDWSSRIVAIRRPTGP